jgi:pyruvate formate-lyase activating enzyme-like uncharacterized protein
MTMTAADRDKIIEQNRQEYGEIYDRLKWPSPQQARSAARHRAELLDDLREAGVTSGCKETKLDCRRLSTGCRCCGDGTWSCLFINGVCGAGCFFCPAPQQDTGQPTTGGVTFTRPQDYLDFLETFQFRGVGISGGEPLRTLERSLLFISKIKKHFGRSIYLWLYTNGSLVSEETLHRLQAAGLDEIRFNIVARGYRLDQVKLAAGIIPVVTVEIPAIPEDFGLMQRLLPQLKEMGVSHLNLHQLRLTPHNYRHLGQRDYTFLHAPQIVVLESELTALRLLKFNEERHIHLPINYCTYTYKNRYQSRGGRRRHANLIKRGYEALTETGMIRSLAAVGEAGALNGLVEAFKRQGADEGLWQRSSSGNRVYFHPYLWRHIDFSGLSLVVSYHNTSLKPSPTYQNAFKEIELNPHKSVFIERWPVFSEVELKADHIPMFAQLYIPGANDQTANPASPSQLHQFSRHLADIPCLEHLPPNLPDYF